MPSLQRRGAVVLIAVLTSCGSTVNTTPVAASQALPATTTAPPSSAPPTTTAPTTNTTDAVKVGRGTKRAVTNCGLEAGAWTLGLDVVDGETNDLDKAQELCREALDLLAIDSTLINRMIVLITTRAELMAEAQDAIAAKGRASDELERTAKDWTAQFAALNRLLVIAP
jgi:hypothetical protein